MNNITAIIFITLFSAGCSNSVNIEGYWMMDMENQPDTYFQPYELKISTDSVELVDGYNFKQKASYQLSENKMTIHFPNELKFNYAFSAQSDSVLNFAGYKYFRIPQDYYSKVEAHQLIGYETSKMKDPDGDFTFVHLVKRNGKPKVILNDVTTELVYLPEFLSGQHGYKPELILYVGKNITLDDLIEAYCYIKPTFLKRAVLITDNKSFEEYYSIADYIEVDSLTYNEFCERINYKPPPPPLEPKMELDIKQSVYIGESSDIELLDTLLDLSNCEILVSNQLHITDYFKLIEKLNNLGGNNKLKRFTTRPKTH